jgi:hypothetical protein
MRTIRNATALTFLVGLIFYMDVTPQTQFVSCYAYWARCADGTCQNPQLPPGVSIPSCNTLCQSSQSCCSGSGEEVEPTPGCGNPGTCEGNTYDKLIVIKNCKCAGKCRTDFDGDGYSPDDDAPAWDCDDTDATINPAFVPTCDSGAGQDYNCDGTDDIQQCNSPVVIDVAGDGFNLTDAPTGVPFDLDGDGVREQLSWTASGSDDAWLALDRNQNGQIDGGSELFGNFTPQPSSTAPNGFNALAAFDRADAGGNSDGWIGAADAVFGRLRLWRDENHDGLSQPAELRSLGEAGISGISTEYRDGGRRDRWGNRFQYRGKVQNAEGRHVGQWAYDVFLMR